MSEPLLTCFTNTSASDFPMLVRGLMSTRSKNDVLEKILPGYLVCQ